MQDTYQPHPPDSATCPHCGRRLDDAAPRETTALQITALYYDCPACGAPWSETRGRARDAERYWTTAAEQAAEAAAKQAPPPRPPLEQLRDWAQDLGPAELGARLLALAEQLTPAQQTELVSVLAEVDNEVANATLDAEHETFERFLVHCGGMATPLRFIWRHVNDDTWCDVCHSAPADSAGGHNAVTTEPSGAPAS